MPRLHCNEQCMTLTASHPTTGIEPIIQTRVGAELAARMPRLAEFATRGGCLPLSRHPGWLSVLEQGLGHVPYCLEATQGDQLLRGILPLAFVRSLLFGRFLVGLPYVNFGGPLADDPAHERALLQEALALADRLNVRYLEIRDERPLENPMLTAHPGIKVHMRLPLPSNADVLWENLDPKVRNQVRKGQKSGLSLAWGMEDLLADFHAVFSENMRDLGTPVYGQELFRAILRQFPDRAELGVARLGAKPVASCLLLHGWGSSEVPSAQLFCELTM